MRYEVEPPRPSQREKPPRPRRREATGVSKIQELVRAGRITPREGAMLLELRGDVKAARWRKRHPILAALVAIRKVLLGV